MTSPYSLKLSWPFIAAFIALRHVFHELHEFGHMIAGRLQCGAWGTRDFNNVQPVVAQCQPGIEGAIAVAFSGPVINYVAMWTGAWMILRTRTGVGKAWGLCLVFAALPFARLFTAVMGGGDELGIFRAMTGQPWLARLACIAFILAMLAWPLAVAWRAMANTPNRAAYFGGFLILPMLLEGAVVLWFFNTLLKWGVLADTWVLGAPALVMLVLVAAILAVGLLASKIKTLVQIHS